MTSSTTSDRPTIFDVVIIGAGPGGEDLTTALLETGFSVALVEKELVGGECFNWACVPSKALLRPGQALKAASRLPGTIRASDAIVADPERALAHRDDVVLHHDDRDVVAAFEKAGAVFFRGLGQLLGPRRVQVEGDGSNEVLHARHAVVLATGSTASIPPVPGLAEVDPWTNREATAAHHAPKRLVVIGSGPAGLELAQAWKSLGSESVTVLSRSARLLPDFEQFVGELLLDGLRASGVDVRFGLQAVKAARHAGEVTLDLSDGSVLRADEVLVATGKVPTTRGLGLETVGIHPDGFLIVDDSMAVPGTDWLYAIGDVNGRALLTHQASYHARVAASSIANRSRGLAIDFTAEADRQTVPQVIFTDPQIASVGLTRQAAEEQGHAVRYVETDLGTVLGAQLHANGYVGRASITVDSYEDVILGATFVGQDVADMVHAATVAITGRVPIRVLRHAVPSFPTMSEVWLDLLKPTDLP